MMKLRRSSTSHGFLCGGADSVRLTIIGTGYVGLNTGVAAAYLGHDVVCVDKDPRKLALLNEGKSPIHEQGLEELLSQVRERIRFTANTPEAVRDADIIMIAVGTPPKSNGEADTSYVEEAVREVAQGLEDRKSTRLNSSHVKISYAVFCLKK